MIINSGDKMMPHIHLHTIESNVKTFDDNYLEVVIIIQIKNKYRK